MMRNNIIKIGVGAVAVTAAGAMMFAPTAAADVTVAPSAGGSSGTYGTGCPVTLTANVTAPDAIPAAVTFLDNGAGIGIGTTDGAGNASVQWTPGTTGQHTIIARYGGFGPSAQTVVNVGTGINAGSSCIVLPF